MNDPNSPISIEDMTKLAKTASEVLPQTTSEIDGALSTMVGWFNNVVLYPVKKANITYSYKLECFEGDLRKKVEQLPQDQICKPKLSIAGPTLEALKYTYDEQELREMYVNLLASSMNTQKATKAHPSFVETIKRMDSLDAKLFKILSKTKGPVTAINPRLEIRNANQYYNGAFPEWFVGWTVEDYDIFQTSASLVRLGKLGIIELKQNRSKTGERGKVEIEQLSKSQLLLEILNSYKAQKPTQDLELTKDTSLIDLNELGTAFAGCCL